VQKILVSACLLGAAVRYHGGDARSDDPVLQQWAREGRLVSVCPEVAGGLSTPRPAAELQRAAPNGSRLKVLVVDEQGRDVSDAFLGGGHSALDLVRRNDIRVAVLKDGSPSCGSSTIHDGTFSGTRIAGEGVTAAMLRSAGVRVFSEHEIAAAAACVAAFDRELP
jgi:uncharacterized protein YbbK (DUF523 family)